MRERIIKRLKERAVQEITKAAKMYFLKEVDPEVYIDSVIGVIYLYTRPKKGAASQQIKFTEVVCAIGHNVRSKCKLPKDSATAARVGAFILYTYEEFGLLKVAKGKGTNGHNLFVIEVTNDLGIGKLWNDLPTSKIEKLPSTKPFVPWTSTRHPTGINLVKTGNQFVLEHLRPETHPIVFDVVNKAQEVGWRINEDIYKLWDWALFYKTEAFADIWELQNPEAKKTKIREARAIGGIAKRFIGKTFYHSYSLDFRGRKYANSTYLHEQGSDLSRGLLLRADKKPVGKGGYFWLLVSLANNWAGEAENIYHAKSDKIPIKDRAQWILDNEVEILAYAEDPKTNRGWMKADKPWQFLAACFELMRLRLWQTKYGQGPDPFEDYGYESSLECFLDGTTNGSQHLAALTKDDITAPHVNLVPLDLPGDLYMYVANHVWNTISDIVSKIEPERKQLIEDYIDNLIELKKAITGAKMKSPERRELVLEIQTFKKEFEKIGEESSAVFWNRIVDKKQRRKIVKREQNIALVKPSEFRG
jgi:DNA-directed RNA polymerase